MSVCRHFPCRTPRLRVFSASLLATAAVSLLSAAAASAVTVSGYVRDTQGIGLANVDLNFYDATTGDNMGYTNDNTDAFGFYSVVVDSERTYDILYRPSPGDPHVAWTAEDVSVGLTNLVLDPVVLESGFFVSGLVTVEGTGTAVQGADIDARNTATGEVISRLGFDNSDFSGGYQVVLRAGTWDIMVSPPSGSNLAGDVQPGVVVTTDTFAGTTTLPPALTVSGTVTDGTSAPLANVNVDAIDLSRGVEIPTTGDHTGSTGQYALRIGAGTYDFIYWPPSGAPLAASVLRNRSVSGNSVLPTVQLLPGLVISGTVRTETGLAVLGADIDAIEIFTGKLYPTHADKSGSGGLYSIRVPSGWYRFVADPPPGSGLLPDTLVTSVSTNQTINFSLPIGSTAGAGDGTAPPPRRPSLGPVFPNPVRREAFVDVRIPAGGSEQVRATVITATGRHVRTLWNGAAMEGNRRLMWDGRDDSGRQAAGGLYFIRVTVGGLTASTRLILVR